MYNSQQILFFVKMESHKLVALELRNIRTSLGVTQEKLALDAGLDRTYVQSIETGKRNISIDVFFRLCEALEVNAHDVIRKISIK